ncbi:MAG: TIGR00730 family Rossman fold protein [Actinomycetota bacterium]|nr:TIGR00730 family Rossman fold protein [Actinomycetota bacterium]
MDDARLNRRPRVAVYCASRLGDDPIFAESADAIGEALAARDLDVVYGGARVGLMGRVADAALAGGSHVIGVLSDELSDREIAHEGLSELRQVETITMRKTMMLELAGGYLALPGGVGTLDELFEVVCWGYLGLHDRPVGLLNVAGYYDHLLAFLEHTVEVGLAKERMRAALLVDDDPVRLVERLADRLDAGGV